MVRGNCVRINQCKLLIEKIIWFVEQYRLYKHICYTGGNEPHTLIQGKEIYKLNLLKRKDGLIILLENEEGPQGQRTLLKSLGTTQREEIYSVTKNDVGTLFPRDYTQVVSLWQEQGPTRDVPCSRVMPREWSPRIPPPSSTFGERGPNLSRSHTDSRCIHSRNVYLQVLIICLVRV